MQGAFARRTQVYNPHTTNMTRQWRKYISSGTWPTNTWIVHTIHMWIKNNHYDTMNNDDDDDTKNAATQQRKRIFVVGPLCKSEGWGVDDFRFGVFCTKVCGMWFMRETLYVMQKVRYCVLCAASLECVLFCWCFLCSGFVI